MDDLKTVLEVRANAYQQMLQDEGYGAKAPQWDGEAKTWDIHVKYEGMAILIMFDLDDPDFVRFVLPNFWDVGPETLGSALVAADLANKQCKGAKVYLNMPRNDTIATVELLDDGSGISAKILIRYLAMLTNAAKLFVNSFREQEQGG